MLQAVKTSQEPGVGERLLTQRDRRADGGARHVRVTRGDILIARRFDGIEMMIAAPVEAYRGVGLVTLSDPQGDILYRVILVHRDADLDIVLGETRDTAEAQDDWRAWAAWFGLTRLAVLDEAWTTVAASGGQRPTGFSAAMRRRPTSSERRRSSLRMREKQGVARQLTGLFGKDREIGGSE
jgi:hypothetical protein